MIVDVLSFQVLGCDLISMTSPNQNASSVFPSPVESELTKRSVEKTWHQDTEWVGVPNAEGDLPKQARLPPKATDFLGVTRRLARPSDVSIFRPADDRPGSWVCEEHYVAGSYGLSCENVRTQLSTPDKDWSRRLPLRPYASASQLPVRPDSTGLAHPASTGLVRKRPVWGIWVKTREHGRGDQLPYTSIAHKETPNDRSFSAPIMSYRSLTRGMDFDRPKRFPPHTSPPMSTQWDYAGGRGGENMLQASSQLRFVPWDDRKFMLTGNRQKNWAFHGLSATAPPKAIRSVLFS